MNQDVSSFTIGLASNLAYDLIKNGARRLKEAAFGTLEQKALRRAYAHAFEVMLEELTLELDEVNRNHVGDLFERFVRDSEVAYLLLDLALMDSDWPLNELRAHFDGQGFDRDTLTIDFDAAMASLVKGGWQRGYKRKRLNRKARSIIG